MDCLKYRRGNIVQISCHQLLKHLNTLSYIYTLKMTIRNDQNLLLTQYTQDQLRYTFLFKKQTKKYNLNVFLNKL